MRAVVLTLEQANQAALCPKLKSKNDDHDYVSWSEVRDLIARRFAFGSHTCSHQKLPQLTLEQVECELRDSKSLIQQHIKTDSLRLAYPYGMTTDQISARAASLGYVCAFMSQSALIGTRTLLSYIASSLETATMSLRLRCVLLVSPAKRVTIIACASLT